MIEGWLSENEGNALAQYSEGKICVEIGSYKGKSTNYIARKANVIYCIDTFKASDDGQTQNNEITSIFDFLNNTKKFNNVVPIVGKSQDLFGCFPDNYIEFLFIDGMHDYDSVNSDIINYLPKLKSNAVICFHDYYDGWTGVVQAVDEHFGKPKILIDSLAIYQL